MLVVVNFCWQFLWSSLVFWVERCCVCSQGLLSLCSFPYLFLLPTMESFSLVQGISYFLPLCSTHRGLQWGWDPPFPACFSLRLAFCHPSSYVLPAGSCSTFIHLRKPKVSPNPVFPELQENPSLFGALIHKWFCLCSGISHCPQWAVGRLSFLHPQDAIYQRAWLSLTTRVPEESSSAWCQPTCQNPPHLS